MSPTDRQLEMLRLVKRGLFFVGIPLLVVSAILIARTVLFVRSALRAEARVTKVEQRIDSDAKNRTRHFYLPSFEFVDSNGTSRTATLDHSSTAYNYDIGKRVAILYPPDPADPVRFDSFFGVWLWPLVTSGATVLVNAMGLACSAGAKNLLKRYEDNARRAAASQEQP